MINRSHAAWALALVSTLAWGLDYDPLDFAHNFAATPQEQQMCQLRIYDRRDPADQANWVHMHHYCDCVRFTNRAVATLSIPAASRHFIQSAIQGCDYVLSLTSTDFKMRPEVHLQKGRALRLGQQDSKAAAEFVEAIKGNPDLALAYAELSDLEARRSGNKQALNIVTEGLRRVPDSKPLQRRYTEYGGKLPYPADPRKAEESPIEMPPPRNPDAPAKQ